MWTFSRCVFNFTIKYVPKWFYAFSPEVIQVLATPHIPISGIVMTNVFAFQLVWCGLNVGLPHYPDSYVENLTRGGMMLGVAALGKKLHLDGRALLDGGLINETPESSLSPPFCHVKTQEEDGLL